MNERIEKLSKEAQLYALDAMIKITDKEQALKVYSETYNTTFAELIVRECIGICEKDGQWYTNTGWLAEAGEAMSLSDQIKKHFGVEE